MADVLKNDKVGAKRRYEKISCQEKEQLAKQYVESVIEMMEEAFFRYEVVLQGYQFETYMSDEEVYKSAELAVDLLEELKDINNSGIDRKKFKDMEVENSAKASDNGLAMLVLWKEFATDRLKSIIGEIDVVRRVGGAWALLIANPGLISAICAVYERMVDSFEDEELYNYSGFFLLRAIMNMHSNEIKAEEGN